MSVVTVVFFAALIIICIIWWYRQINKNFEYLKNIPGPPTVPGFGNALDIGSTKDILPVLLKYVKDHGGILKIQAGPVRKGLVITDYKFLEYILGTTKILNKSQDYVHLQSWLGTGLLTSDGPKWRKHRRILTPTFHFQILEQFIGVFESNGDILIKKLAKEVGKNSMDVYHYITLCTLDIICESAMGTKVNAQSNDKSDYVLSVKAMCRIIMERTFSFFQMFDLTYPLTKNYYAEKQALKILHAYTNNVISKRRSQLENKTQTNGHDNFAIKNKKTFLDLLLDTAVDEKPLTHEEIREEVDTFMFEGHDTTASAISFALFCLANHPEVQQKVFEEQQALFCGDKNPVPTYADLQSMKYLEQVIKETLRLYPSVPFYGRETSEPVEFNGIIIPKGIEILIFAYGMHRNPEYFEEPEEFKPSRFEKFDGKQPYSYIPFSAGPRNCIGQKFAMLEMKSTISKIIRNFELHPATPHHELQLAAETVLKSANGVKVALKERK